MTDRNRQTDIKTDTDKQMTPHTHLIHTHGTEIDRINNDILNDDHSSILCKSYTEKKRT